VNPVAPAGLGPVGPVTPADPAGPVTPADPAGLGPVTPADPVGAVNPVAPAGLGPVGPLDPVGPFGPVTPGLFDACPVHTPDESITFTVPTVIPFLTLKLELVAIYYSTFFSNSSIALCCSLIACINNGINFS
jgi:hypothetical protein